MGMYNLLKLTIVCPWCDTEGDVEAEFRFGLRDLTECDTPPGFRVYRRIIARLLPSSLQA
jgi:hypothetical protein